MANSDNCWYWSMKSDFYRCFVGYFSWNGKTITVEYKEVLWQFFCEFSVERI